MNIFCDANKIYEAGTKSIKAAPFKQQTQLFEMNQLLLTAELQKAMKEKTYKPTKGRKFTIKERGKIRHITTNNMIDKTVNHLMCDNVLSPAIKPYLIYDNGASQTGKGVAFHRKRLEIHLHQYYRQHKNNEGYILLIDFSGYYASIPHDLCLENLQQFLKKADKEEAQITLWILKNIFEIFNIDNKNRRGVDIGSQPSQNIGIAYPARIDNYIKIVKGVKHYGRYTDDMYIIHESKEFLKQLLKEIQQIANELGLIINPKKTHLCKLSQTFRILQLQYKLTETGRVVRKIHPKSITRERRKLKAYKRLLEQKRLTYEEIENIFKSWMSSNYKNMSMQQITNMSQLYYNLFRRKVTWKNHGKLRYLMERNLQILD
ncbi:MAG: RNA-directed DNA polymerase [Clostridia bacterium]|nr:RNA-directed DNA polymerase [Clostridia bacterium]